MELGKDIPDSQVEEVITNQKPSDCCLLVYTVRHLLKLEVLIKIRMHAAQYTEGM